MIEASGDLNAGLAQSVDDRAGFFADRIGDKFCNAGHFLCDFVTARGEALDQHGSFVLQQGLKHAALIQQCVLQLLGAIGEAGIEFGNPLGEHCFQRDRINRRRNFLNALIHDAGNGERVFNEGFSHS